MDWSLVAAVNDEQVLQGSLLSSPDAATCEIVIERGFPTCGAAYQEGLRETSKEIIVFAHQDVYLPNGWRRKVEAAIATLADHDPDWAVLGVFGVDLNDRCHGHVYSTGSRRVLGSPFVDAIPAQSLDEMVLIVRRSAGIGFDPELPGYHLYGTDICLTARRAGLRSYVIPAFCLHNSNGIRSLPASFWKAYRYLRKKWWSVLPVSTCCTRITKSPLAVLKFRTKELVNSHLSPREPGHRVADPEQLYLSRFS